MLSSTRSRGFTLVEIGITLTVVALLLMLGLPAMGEWLQNTQIRNAAEAVMNGMQSARAAAVQRNVPVRFQFVDTLDASCALSATGPHWIISRNNPSNACDQAEVTDFIEPNDTSVPLILEKRTNAEGTPNAAYSATDNGAASSTVIFNSLGRVVNGTGIDRVDISNATGTCKHAGGNLRCLAVTVSIGGDIKLCDPDVTTVGDTRRC